MQVRKQDWNRKLYILGEEVWGIKAKGKKKKKQRWVLWGVKKKKKKKKKKGKKASR